MKRSEDRRTGAQTRGRTGAHSHRRSDDVPRVLVARAGGVATLTLNRPLKRNAMDRRMIAELGAALETADLAADVVVVALRGAGNDFCAGLDLYELLASADLPVEENERRALELGEVLIALRKMPKVTVALVHGRALAGGCGLATACDLVLARSGSEFGYPEIRRGFVPAMVMTMLRRAVGEKVAFDLAATGRIVDADEAERLGLVSRVLPARGFERGAKKLLQEIAGFSASALALIKQHFYQLDGLGALEGIRLGARVNALARATPEFRQVIAAFLKK